MGRRTPAPDPSAVATAEISGMGGRYVCSFRATHVWDRGRLMEPEPDGLTYVLTHPDLAAEGISEVLSREEIHRLAFGRSIPGGGTITRDQVVRDSKGEVLPRTTMPVGWSRHEMPAVKIGGELVLIADLMKFAHGGQGAVAIAPGRVPGYLGDNNGDD